MAASTIVVGGATFNFITLRGEPEVVGVERQEVSRPGVNGHAYWEEGKRGRTFVMEGYLDYTTLVAAAIGFDAMKAKQGQIASSVSDDRDRPYNNVAILAVEKVAIRPIAGNIGGKISTGNAQALLIVPVHMQSTR